MLNSCFLTQWVPCDFISNVIVSVIICMLCSVSLRLPRLGSIVSLVVVIVSKCLGTFFIVYRNMCFGGFSNPVDFYFNHCIINIQFILFCLLYHHGTTFVQNNCRFGRVISVWWNDVSTRHTSLVSVWNGPMYRYVIITSNWNIISFRASDCFSRHA